MKRSLFLLGIGIGMVVLVVACSEPTGPGVGGIGLRLVSANGAGQAQAGTLDSLRVKVTGPTTKTVEFACSSTTCSGTVDGLAEGSYAVTVAGLVGGAVSYYGTATSVTVTAGQSTAATIGNWESFQPVLTVPMDTTEVLSIPLSFTPVTLASSYVVEWSHTQDFTGAPADTLTVTTDTIAVADSGQYYVRVRAVNADVGSGGQASPAAAVYVTHGVATVTLTPGTPTVAAGATLQLTATAVDINGDTVQGVTFFWSSDDQSVASVDQSGLVTGKALGQVTITAVGKGQPGSTAITVTFGAPAQLAFRSAPATAEPFGTVDTVWVAVEDANGNQTDAAVDVTIAIGTNPSGGTLSGTKTVTSVNGVAAFDDLAIDSSGAGYTLDATASGLTGKSTTLDVVLKFVQIGTGWYHSCGLTTTGAVYCWGQNTGDQLGVGSTTPTQSTIPLRVVGGQQFSALSVGEYHACALRASDGYAFCWGGGGAGRLGDGGTSLQGTPDSVHVGSAFLSISAGGGHTCGIRASDGRVLCWGMAGSGQLGNNVTSPDQLVPVLTSDAAAYTSVTAGDAHTCGIRQSDGRVLCWGAPTNGRLGNNNTTTNVLVPTTNSYAAAFASVRTAYDHTCGVLADGTNTGLCWGLNNFGQVGNGATGDVLVPTWIVNSIQWARIVPGYWHTCGITVGGQTYCWGYNDAGRSGLGVTTGNTLTPQLMSLTFSAIANGAYHGCGIASDGTYCWGYNAAGELGTGSTATSSTPTPVRGTR